MKKSPIVLIETSDSFEKRSKLEEKVIKAAIKWYDPDLVDCQYGRKCKKHARTCQLMYAIRDLVEFTGVTK